MRSAVADCRELLAQVRLALALVGARTRAIIITIMGKQAQAQMPWQQNNLTKFKIAMTLL